jgi:hypothetical protein
MASIYEGAEVIIAASDVYDGSYGFLHPRDENPPVSVVDRRTEEGRISTIRSRPWDQHMWYHTPLSNSPNDTFPLSTRGWAFQERLLATRYVQFRSHEIVWECRSCLKCECGFLSRPSQARTKSTKVALREAIKYTDKLDVLKLWPNIVDAYAVRKLTNMDDTLPACLGLQNNSKPRALVSTLLAYGWIHCLVLYFGKLGV